jgi:hypothetical protein
MITELIAPFFINEKIGLFPTQLEIFIYYITYIVELKVLFFIE